MLPVVDIKLRMGNGETDYSCQQDSSDERRPCIIVLDINSISLGIIVDSVRQVIDIDLKNVRPIPLKRQQKLLNGMVNMEDGGVYMSIDCEALSFAEL